MAAVMLTLGANYQTRFWVTLGMVILIGGSVGLKVVVSIFYMVLYKIRTPKIEGHPNLKIKSRIGKKMRKCQSTIREEILKNLEDVVEREYVTKDLLGSFIQASRTKQE